MKFTPKPWAILFAIFGVGGIFYFMSMISNPWYQYNIICCDQCKILTLILASSVIAILIAVLGMFKKEN